MKKILIVAASVSVILSMLIILIALGVFRPKCSVDFATRVTFTSTVHDDDGKRNVDTHDLTEDSLDTLKEIFNGQRIYRNFDEHIGFENYILTFTDGIKTVRIRVADDGSSYIKHDKGYFTLKDDEKERLYRIIYIYM